MAIFNKNFSKYLSINWVTRALNSLSVSVDAIADAVVPDGGTTGQVLTKYSNEDFEARWEDPAGGLPEGGTVGQVLTVGSDGPEWDDPAGGSDTAATIALGPLLVSPTINLVNTNYQSSANLSMDFPAPAASANMKNLFIYAVLSFTPTAGSASYVYCGIPLMIANTGDDIRYIPCPVTVPVHVTEGATHKVFTLYITGNPTVGGDEMPISLSASAYTNDDIDNTYNIGLVEANLYYTVNS